MSDVANTIAHNAPAGKASPAEARRANEARARAKGYAAPSLADVQNLAPNDDQMAKITSSFGIEAGDADELTGLGSNMIRDQYTTLAPVLVTMYRGEPNYQGLKIHLDRVVDGLVRSAYGAAEFYEKRRLAAKDAVNAFSNEHRDEDRMGIDGGANRVDGLREIAAQHAAKAYSLACVAAGACAAYEELMGQAWEPYVGNNRRSVSEQAAALRNDALGF
ncbi:hypothetical protein DY926_16470 [Komagataeibacter melaceti]|uniref:Uncharacterized protein n=1 Tax=Komagataeibacter melaceti TaxID=2766577 RepID=A0A371YW72_9PROT|nr:hypothetical protein [Komagataeibacter melaceti]RFD18475.1 hypothetical protein DY926_16470 [Komagataeibacter melaceti]